MNDNEAVTSPSPDNEQLIAAATDQVTGAAFFLSVRESAEISIQSRTVPVGLWKKHEEQGFMLANGFALLESEKDADGNYIGGAGIDGMYTKTPHRFQPVLDENGQLRAFRDVTEAYNHKYSHNCVDILPPMWQVLYRAAAHFFSLHNHNIRFGKHQKKRT